MRRTGLLWLGLALGLAAGARDSAERWIDRTEMAPRAVQHSVEVLDRGGRLLRAYTVDDGLWRLPVRLDQVDPIYLEMLVGYEDKRFWTHSGVDPWAMARAVGLAVRHGRLLSGGSTLTMQVARLLEDGTTGQLAGKLRQMRVAWALERQLSKAEILTLYLNLAPFGGNLEGLRSASFAYFGKEPHRLTPAEAALLVALPQAPSSRRPDRFPDRAEAGRDRVLRKAVAAGTIGAETAQAARRDPVPRSRTDFPAHAPHLSDRLRAAAPLTQTHGTTLDLDLQRTLETLARERGEAMGPQLTVAMVVADPATGRIHAHVGATAYTSDARSGWVDMTAAKRSPGSTLKPLIYGLGFDLGLLHPESLMDDRPTSFAGYAPRNFDGAYRGPVRAEDALQLSLNVPAIALTEAIGPGRLIARLRRAGADPVLQDGGAPGLAVALGGLGMTLEDLTGLYAALARGGQAPALRWTEAATPPPPGRLLSREAAAEVTRILAETPPPDHGIRRRIAYKTGTSYGNRDAWALGYSGGIVAGVWVGRADGTAVPGLSGASHAAPLLFDVLQRADPAATPLPPPPPRSAAPPHLRQFGSGPGGRAKEGLSLAFPRPGTTVHMAPGLTLKVQDGQPPFTWVINGAPLVIGARRRSVEIEGVPGGPAHIAVIDGLGRSDSVEVTLGRAP